jgi:NADPH-dependent 2,4-dienoyl-CoA reductase/sulfur reductase-like enzyme/rhodanese-related sulfurtransferase
VIIGGVAAGMSGATRVRRREETMEIGVLERGDHVSFANCGLPYHVGGVIEDRAELLLQTPESLSDRFAIDVRTRHEVVAIARDRRVVQVHDRCAGRMLEEAYDALVLATGAAPLRPPIPGVETGYALRDLADMDAIVDRLDAPDAPRTAVIVGAGFIGLELAENLHRRGLAVTVVELAEHVLPPLDVEMAGVVQEHLVASGVRVLTGVSVTAIDPDSVTLSTGDRVPAGMTLLAAGVAPESALARAAGLALSDRGGVVVDDRQRTSDPAIYAVGDVAVKRDAVTGDGVLVPLAQTANRHGRLVADAIVGRPVASRPVLGSAVVGVFGLTVATVGWTEKRLRAADREIRVVHTHPNDHAGYFPGAEAMTLKLLVDADTDEILGAQGVGRSGVDKRIDVIATAMRGGLRASELTDLELTYAPQYGSAKDPVNMLGMVAENLRTGVARTVQWHQVDAEQRSGAVVVDVRTAEEFATGSVPGAVNLPLDELRLRHEELPVGRLVVTCAAGLRGYVATRLLTQLGHGDTVNLDGGLLSWRYGEQFGGRRGHRGVAAGQAVR